MRCNKIRCQDREHKSCVHSHTHSSFSIFHKTSYHLCNEEYDCYAGSAFYRGRKNVKCVSEFEYAILKSLDKIKRTRKKYRKHELD